MLPLRTQPSKESPVVEARLELTIEAERRRLIREVSEGVVLDYDAAGNLVGIEIDNASKKVDLRKLILSWLPGEVHTIAA